MQEGGNYLQRDACVQVPTGEYPTHEFLEELITGYMCSDPQIEERLLVSNGYKFITNLESAEWTLQFQRDPTP